MPLTNTKKYLLTYLVGPVRENVVSHLLAVLILKSPLQMYTIVF